MHPSLINGRQSSLKLTPKGEDQAKCLRVSLANEKFDAIYCSTAVRAQMTAKLAGLEPVQVIADITEASQGSFEQRPRNEMWTESVRRDMEENPWTFKAPGLSPEGVAGESCFEVEMRMTRFVESLLESEDKTPVTIAIISHASAIRDFLRGVLESHPSRVWKAYIPNTAITELEYVPGQAQGTRGWWLRRLGCTKHLLHMDTLPRPAEGGRQAIKAVTVFCSSSARLNPLYYDVAFELGQALARAGLRQVNGGGGGMMEACSKGCLEAKGELSCVVLGASGNSSRDYHKLAQEVVFEETLEHRKPQLYSRGDAFVVLPGGLGTLEEMAEVLSLAGLGLQKLVVLVNANGFYDSLCAHVNHLIRENMMTEDIMTALKIVPDVASAMKLLLEHDSTSIHVNKASLWNSKHE